jgi:hypothetical protein
VSEQKGGGSLVPDEVIAELIDWQTRTSEAIHHHFAPSVKMTPQMRLRWIWLGSRWPLVIDALRNRHECGDDW